jgi:hypothetical protein
MGPPGGYPISRLDLVEYPHQAFQSSYLFFELTQDHQGDHALVLFEN